MPNEPNEPTTITQPSFTLAPENFRRIMQKQISATVTKKANRTGVSGLGKTMMMENQYGFPYLVVGFDPVDDTHIAHP